MPIFKALCCDCEHIRSFLILPFCQKMVPKFMQRVGRGSGVMFTRLGVLEDGIFILILALRLPILNLTLLAASPSGRWKSPKRSA